jgi:hypothetical protein
LAWRRMRELICGGIEREGLVCDCCADDGGTGDGVNEGVTIWNADCSRGVPDYAIAEGGDIAVTGDANVRGSGNCGGITEGNGVCVNCQELKETFTIAGFRGDNGGQKSEKCEKSEELHHLKGREEIEIVVKMR